MINYDDPQQKERIQTMFREFRNGDVHYFYLLVAEFLDLLTEELMDFEEELEPVGLVLLLFAIKSYDSTQEESATKYVKQYIHLNLLINQENHTRLNPNTVEIYFPAHHVMILNVLFQKYLKDLRQNKEALQKKGEEKSSKKLIK